MHHRSRADAGEVNWLEAQVESRGVGSQTEVARLRSNKKRVSYTRDNIMAALLPFLPRARAHAQLVLLTVRAGIEVDVPIHHKVLIGPVAVEEGAGVEVND